MSFINVIIVGLSGFIGTVLRYLIGSIPVPLVRAENPTFILW